jgi:hypothetical protein
MKALFYRSENFFLDDSFDLPYSLLKDFFQEKEIQKMKDLGIFALKGKDHLIFIHLKDPKKVEEEIGGFFVLKQKITKLVNEVADRSIKKVSDIIVYDEVYAKFKSKLKSWAKGEEEISAEDIDVFADHQFPLSDLLSFLSQ